MDIMDSSEVLMAAVRVLAGEGRTVAAISAFLTKARAEGPSSCLAVWDECGAHVACLKYAAACPVRVAEIARAEIFEPLVAMDDANPAGLPCALRRMLEQLQPERAVTVAVYVLDAYLRALVDREDAYAPDLEMLFDAYSQTFFGDGNPAIMMLPKPSRYVNRFLREHDPKQMIKFVVAPRKEAGGGGWQLYTVNYKRQPFNTYVPIATEHGIPAPYVRFIHKKRFVAVLTTQRAAHELAVKSMQEYQRWSNLPARMLRWWAE